LLTTVDRETKADKTHHAAALRRQSKGGDRLVTNLKAAERHEHATAIASILTKLNAHGVTQATVQRLAPSGAHRRSVRPARAHAVSGPRIAGIANRGREE